MIDRRAQELTPPRFILIFDQPDGQFGAQRQDFSGRFRPLLRLVDTRGIRQT